MLRNAFRKKTSPPPRALNLSLALDPAPTNFALHETVNPRASPPAAAPETTVFPSRIPGRRETDPGRALSGGPLFLPPGGPSPTPGPAPGAFCRDGIAGLFYRAFSGFPRTQAAPSPPPPPRRRPRGRPPRLQGRRSTGTRIANCASRTGCRPRGGPSFEKTRRARDRWAFISFPREA